MAGSIQVTLGLEELADGDTQELGKTLLAGPDLDSVIGVEPLVFTGSPR